MRRRPVAREAGRAEGDGEVEGEALRLAATGVSFERGEKVKCEEVVAQVGHRPQRTEAQGPPLWRQVPTKAGGGGPHSWDPHPKENGRGRSMDGQPDRGGPKPEDVRAEPLLVGERGEGASKGSGAKAATGEEKAEKKKEKRRGRRAKVEAKAQRRAKRRSI